MQPVSSKNSIGRGMQIAFQALAEKYSGDQAEESKRKEIEGCTKACIVAIDIEHITGKESFEYVKAKGASLSQ